MEKENELPKPDFKDARIEELEKKVAMFENVLSGSEAVYGFCAWLTCRDATLKLGAKHNCAPVCELIKLFCETNLISEPRDNYTDFLTHPVEIQ